MIEKALLRNNIPFTAYASKIVVGFIFRAATKYKNDTNNVVLVYKMVDNNSYYVNIDSKKGVMSRSDLLQYLSKNRYNDVGGISSITVKEAYDQYLKEKEDGKIIYF